MYKTCFHAYCWKFSFCVFKSWKQIPLPHWLFPFLGYYQNPGFTKWYHQDFGWLFWIAVSEPGTFSWISLQLLERILQWALNHFLLSQRPDGEDASLSELFHWQSSGVSIGVGPSPCLCRWHGRVPLLWLCPLAAGSAHGTTAAEVGELQQCEMKLLNCNSTKF